MAFTIKITTPLTTRYGTMVVTITCPASEPGANLYGCTPVPENTRTFKYECERRLVDGEIVISSGATADNMFSLHVIGPKGKKTWMVSETIHGCTIPASVVDYKSLDKSVKTAYKTFCTAYHELPAKPACRNGSNCTYRVNGTCKFTH